MSRLHRSHTGFAYPPVSRLLLPAFFLCILLPACKPATPDYDLYENMGAYMKGKLETAGATARTDMPDLFASESGYTQRLRGLIRLVFGSPKLQVYLRSYASPRIAVGSISQFEAPPQSGTYTDCAFVVRPSAAIGAPIMHGDARAPMAGSDEEFAMDFYRYDNATDVEAFFGAQKTKLDQAMELVANYQIPELDEKGERDRGHLTAYLDHYKSKYRLELAAPESKDEADHKAYVDAVLQAFKLYQDAYFEALAAAQPDNDTAIIDSRNQAAGAFINLFEENDFAVKLGRMLFGKQNFPLYFNEGFWREGVYGDNETLGALL